MQNQRNEQNPAKKPLPRLLIVDDDIDVQATLKKRLSFQGFECLTASSVEDGLKKLDAINPDLILLDLGFPGPSGTAFLENAHQYLSPGKKIPPIVVLSCYNDQEIKSLVFDDGAVDFISKPYDPNQLLSVIQRHLH